MILRELLVLREKVGEGVTKGQGLDPHPKYLRVRREIPAGTLFTVFGGITVQEQTQGRVFNLNRSKKFTSTSTRRKGRRNFNTLVKRGVGLKGAYLGSPTQ